MLSGGNNMKVVSKVSVLFVLLCGLFLFGSSNSQATDVWVSQYDGVDTYVMDNTIKHGVTSSGRWVSVSTKNVRNGQLVDTITWRFSKYSNVMWRYTTTKMRPGYDLAISSTNHIFEYSMKRIGWSYRVETIRGLSYYY